MKPEIVIFGNGWLGNKYKAYFGKRAVISFADISDPAAVAKDLDAYKPACVINTAGKTGKPNIDWCETHKLETLNSNVTGPLVLLRACLERDIFMTHLSSGCIFQGNNKGKGFAETDRPDPPSFYSWTKAVSDGLLDKFPVLIIRLRMPIDSEPNPRNLIAKLVNYPNVIDIENSVTVVSDLLKATDALMQKKKTGIYHVTNPGPVRHSDILELYKKIVDPSHAYALITYKQLLQKGLVKAGRSNCILNTDKLRKAGVRLPNAKKVLAALLREYRKKKNA